MKKIRHCLNCGKIIPNRHNKKYCCHPCSCEYAQNARIQQWLDGAILGHAKSVNHDIRSFVRVYLHKKYSDSCVDCGFSGINQFTGKSILQVHHIDGNSLNSRPENLVLLCPNCHSLTKNYMNNRGHKSARKNRYGELTER